MHEVYFKRWLAYLHSIPKWKLTWLALLAMLFILVLEAVVVFVLDLSTTENPDHKAEIRIFSGLFGPILIAPILETLFFQTLFFRVGRKISLRSEYTLILSSLLFALGHRLNPMDIFFYFLNGIVLYGHYLLLKDRQQKAFWPTCFVHAAFNFIVVTPYWGIVYYEKMYGQLH